ncbi:citrate lyase acyl carrier protein [Streptococcus parauberis]|uniref:Citrate lyase acyl carrier protein n=3 Tax=Streptococcus parauberis TaxID=1348 RepID=A0A0E2UEB9_9STRE|nr:citrate lyase acyl carrier protein [Streptococcus parauberis]AEF24562.1 citrate lyase acyl carrier protein [Streptococcus parauberis KCTC 11537]AUT05041.1 Citrate lyase acyl carrier protein [Streptococcus parauberis]EGE54047.1 citrate lyase acyl carrier protein [Streptococcus parauberis NCFD 2020]EMF48498.1 Citrate lyase gamma chain, acyl carrier protein [Streptococcus parauberis KRS-02109]EMG25133.1 Citrate lyase gamma chain, acyl carrier protein [Streptococcus parauberis KRS-02083]
MEIKQTAVAGSLESSDIMVTVSPATNGIQIDLESSVEKQFGRRIRQVIEETVKNLQVENIGIHAVDKGALDCTVQARTIAAVHRAVGLDQYDWKEIDSWNV